MSPFSFYNSIKHTDAHTRTPTETHTYVIKRVWLPRLVTSRYWGFRALENCQKVEESVVFVLLAPVTVTWGARWKFEDDALLLELDRFLRGHGSPKRRVGKRPSETRTPEWKRSEREGVNPNKRTIPASRSAPASRLRDPHRSAADFAPILLGPGSLGMLSKFPAAVC